jgi:hypothetical protein
MFRRDGGGGQPELASARMDNWAAYLRGQADALNVPNIDTGGLPVTVAPGELIGVVESLDQE